MVNLSKLLFAELYLERARLKGDLHAILFCIARNLDLIIKRFEGKRSEVEPLRGLGEIRKLVGECFMLHENGALRFVLENVMIIRLDAVVLPDEFGVHALVLKRCDTVIAVPVVSYVRDDGRGEAEAKRGNRRIRTVSHRKNFFNGFKGYLLSELYTELAILVVKIAVNFRIFEADKGVYDDVPESDKIVFHGRIVTRYNQLMRTLREVITDARGRGVAVGHFNFSDSTQLNTIARTARELGVPVMVGVSEGERAFIGVAQAAALVGVFRAQGQEIYLNADHTKSLDGVKEAIDAGFDEVLFDGSKLSIDDNIVQAKEVVAYARASGRDVLIEGELGYIGASSQVLDAIPEGAGLDKTDPDTAARFVAETALDLLAPSVGNIHGMLKNVPDPALDIPRIGAIAQKAGVPLVLHGASGNSEEDVRAAIKNGVAVVHINTEIRAAYRAGIEAGLAASDDVSPAKYLAPGVDQMKAVVTTKLSWFNGL